MGNPRGHSEKMQTPHRQMEVGIVLGTIRLASFLHLYWLTAPQHPQFLPTSSDHTSGLLPSSLSPSFFDVLQTPLHPTLFAK